MANYQCYSYVGGEVGAWRILVLGSVTGGVDICKGSLTEGHSPDEGQEVQDKLWGPKRHARM